MKYLACLLFLSVSVMLFGQRDTVFVTWSDSVEGWFQAGTQEARNKGMILPEWKKKRPAEVRFNGASWAAKVGMKGDWADHIEEDRWSFALRLEEGNVYDASSFSLLLPQSRGDRAAQAFHLALRQEDVLTTQYSFVQVFVNGKDWGEMVFEAHFGEAFIQGNKLPDGPILKFEDDGFWECQMINRHDPSNCLEYPIFDVADIRTYGKKRMKKSAILTARFEEASSILAQWRNGKLPLEQIDLEKFARYYALCDLFGFYHGLDWYNQRFYYRQSDGKIEPVAYDCYSADPNYIGKPLLGNFEAAHDTVYASELWFTYRLFNVPEFEKQYRSALQDLLDTPFWLVSTYDPDLRTRIQTRVSMIKRYLESESKGEKQIAYYPDAQWKEDHPDEPTRYRKNLPLEPLPSVSLRATQSYNTLRITNYHHAKMILFATETDGIVQPCEPPVELEPDMGFGIVNFRADKIYARDVQGKEWIYKVSNERPQREFETYIEPKYVFRWDEVWTLTDKERNIDWIVVIPENENLKLEDCTLHFGPKGKIICYGEARIRNCTVTGTGAGDNGFRFFGEHTWIEKSTFRHMTVDSLGGSSPLEFVGTDVRLEEVLFEGIQAKNAVHFVDCKVEIEQLGIHGCADDGLHLDFCSGYMKNVEVAEAGGDGIDFSGSSLNVFNLNVSGSGDKGVSIGERSQIESVLWNIAHCPIGIAVKDESTLKLHAQPSVEACGIPISLFRKKQFYEKGDALTQVE